MMRRGSGEPNSALVHTMHLEPAVPLAKSTQRGCQPSRAGARLVQAPDDIPGGARWSNRRILINRDAPKTSSFDHP